MRRILAQMRPSRNAPFLGCDGKLPSRDWRYEKRAGFLILADGNERLVEQLRFATHQPVERVGVEQDAWQGLALRVGGAAIASLRTLHRL